MVVFSIVVFDFKIAYNASKETKHIIESGG